MECPQRSSSVIAVVDSSQMEHFEVELEPVPIGEIGRVSRKISRPIVLGMPHTDIHHGPIANVPPVGELCVRKKQEDTRCKPKYSYSKFFITPTSQLERVNSEYQGGGDPT